jgi:hypothetical protein
MWTQSPRTISPAMRIGLDFDNTIIGYADVFLAAAQERGLVGSEMRKASKQAVRDAIRLLPDGEIAWQHLQGFVYGRGIRNATMFGGVDGFLRRCRTEGHETFIVSHKTEYGHYDPERINLREAALDWMSAHGFFSHDGYAIPRDNVYFESSRAAKLRRIARLGCTHFVDDLEEVLNDPEFPPSVERILFSDTAASGLPFAVCPTWQRVEKVVFNGHG